MPCTINIDHMNTTKVKKFTFSPFHENTYVVYDDSKECIIFDPGTYTDVEFQTLTDFINKERLKPVKLINTHCHVDHMFGNTKVAKEFGLTLAANEKEVFILENAPEWGSKYGLVVEPSLPITEFLNGGDEVKFGNTTLSLRFTPGHSPGSLSFYCEAANFVLVGDALFQGSIGRVDLPMGDYDTLIDSIKKELFTLPEETVVFSGHGDETTIGIEKRTNPFFK